MEKMIKPGTGGAKEIVPAEGIVSGKVAQIGEHPTNFEAVMHDEVGQYQTDTDVKGTVYQDNYPSATPETPANSGN